MTDPRHTAEANAFDAWRATFHFRSVESFRKEYPGFSDDGPEIFNGVCAVFEADDSAHVGLLSDGKFILNVGNFSALYPSLGEAAIHLWREHSLHEWRYRQKS